MPTNRTHAHTWALLAHAIFSVHELDARRFDVRYEQDTMFFRANTQEDRDAWLAVLHQAQALVNSSGLKRSGSLGSIVSTTSATSMGTRSVVRAYQ